MRSRPVRPFLFPDLPILSIVGDAILRTPT
jgi:hypothetical protein